MEVTVGRSALAAFTIVILALFAPPTGYVYHFKAYAPIAAFMALDGVIKLMLCTYAALAAASYFREDVSFHTTKLFYNPRAALEVEADWKSKEESRKQAVDALRSSIIGGSRSTGN